MMYSKIADVSPTDFTPTPEQPNDGFSWDFNKGDIMGWEFEVYINGTDIKLPSYLFAESFPNLIINISDFKYEDFAGSNYYYIETDFLYYNVNTSTLDYMATTNKSLINFTNGEMYIDSFQTFTHPHATLMIWDMYANYFIPKNGTELALDWCAHALNKTTYSGSFMNTTIDIDYGSNTITYSNESMNDYFSFRYFENGTLDTAEMFFETMINNPLHHTNMTWKFKRTSDFNSVDDVFWEINIDDLLIYDIGGEIRKYKIIDFVEYTTTMYQSLSEVRADVWILNESAEWELIYNNRTIGAANEYIGFPLSSGGQEFLIMPTYPPLEDIQKIFEMLTAMMPENSYHSHENSIKIVNNTSGDYMITQWADDGIVTHIMSKGNFMAMFPFNTSLLCYNPDNIEASIVDGEEESQLNDIGSGGKFDVSLDIFVSEISQMIYSSSIKNPVNLQLNESLFFLDISLNESENLNSVNITIQYDDQEYSDIEIWWFNQSANDGFGKWEKMNYTDLGNGTITLSIEHLSVFSLSGSLIDQPPDGDGEGDDVPYIHFGYYFLIYLAIAMSLGIIHTFQRKINLKN
ncbi:MAG: hypothetical protein BAJALOKI3v1_750019 [Promethearchaeota archaeon]|nr:MAG: hypothetical protein BAJALOKI3v1_750019 [Candidatus Lokiarchaeota archaeon]